MVNPAVRRLGAELSLGTIGGLIPRRFPAVVALEAAPPSDGDWWEAQRALIGELTEVLARHTDTEDEVDVALWVGHGFDLDQVFPESRALITAERTYRVRRGPISAVDELRWRGPDGEPSHWFRPDLWSPADDAWFVGTDVDFWTTFIGGSASLADKLLHRFGDRCRRADRAEPLPTEN